MSQTAGPLGSTAHSVDHVRVVASWEDQTYCVNVHGELDLGCVAELEAELRRAVDTTARTIVVDLSGLDFIDSCGVSALLNAHRRCRSRLVLLRGPRRVHRVFELTGLAHVLPFADG